MPFLGPYVHARANESPKQVMYGHAGAYAVRPRCDHTAYGLGLNVNEAGDHTGLDSIKFNVKARDHTAPDSYFGEFGGMALDDESS